MTRLNCCLVCFSALFAFQVPASGQEENVFRSAKGSLFASQGQRIVFNEEGETKPLDLTLTRESLIRLYAPISADYVEPGCVGRVTGTFDVDKQIIEDAQFQIYLTAYDSKVAFGTAREPHYDVRQGTFSEKQINVDFYAMLTSMPPDLWKVKGINQKHVSRYYLQVPGQSAEDASTHEFETFGREFVINPEIFELEGEKYLYVRLPANWRIDPELKPRGDVEYYPISGRIRTLYLYFAEPIEPKDLGIRKKKKASSTNEKKQSTRKSKSKRKD